MFQLNDDGAGLYAFRSEKSRQMKRAALLRQAHECQSTRSTRVGHQSTYENRLRRPKLWRSRFRLRWGH